MEQIRFERIGETMFHQVLDNGLNVFVFPKPEFQKKYAFFATNYGGMDLRFQLDGFAHAMGAKNQGSACRHFIQVFNKDSALGLQIVHHKGVVHDLVADIDRRAMQRQRLLDGVDALLADLVRAHRLVDDGQQVVDVRFLLIAQVFGVLLQHPIGLLEGFFGHG